jgi:hypothetical protein
MGPFYHLQVGSFLANAGKNDLRERRMIMYSALLTDIDGIPGLVNPDWMSLHHTFSHNLFFALVIAGIFSVLGRSRRPELFVFCFASSILQVVLDNLTNDVSWSIMYFWPVWQKDFSLANFSSWSHLNAFVKYGVQGAFMVAVLAGTVILYLRTGRTFIEVFSARLDKFITDFLTLPFRAHCAECGNRAFYRETVTQTPLCGRHAHFRRDLTIEGRNYPAVDPPS